MTVNDLIEQLLTLPPDAEVRVTKPLDTENSINQPASDVRFDQIGPLLYVEII